MSKLNKIVAMLPMKGHSERVPNKNLRDFAGKPLFHWIIDTLLKSQYIDVIYVDTDSDKIASSAQRISTKIKIIDRPENLLGDDVSMNKIISHDIGEIGAEYYIQTHSTNPLLTTKTIDNAIEQYFADIDVYDSIFSVTTHHTRLYNANQKPINHDPKILLRTQDLPPIYEENSNFYIFSKSSFNRSGNRIGITPKMYPMDKLESMDIDTLDEFLIAESYLKSKILQGTIE